MYYKRLLEFMKAVFYIFLINIYLNSIFSLFPIKLQRKYSRLYPETIPNHF
jgi:hypothetical protein